ncbi:MAG: hypothetical protein FJ298_05940 [Planctomycetes bacterium]|nr:hypothetical protein [Planctomycetota bacterium]
MRLVPPTQDNPYAAPQAELLHSPEVRGRVWRDGKLLRLEKGAQLPQRCVRCNAPAEVHIDRKLCWHSPWWALLIFAGVLTYAIVALIVRKRADVRIRPCDEHARARRRTLLGLGALALFGVVACIWAPVGLRGTGVLLGAVLPLVAFFVGQRRSSVLQPVRIDKEEAVLKGASEEYLASLERRAA